MQSRGYGSQGGNNISSFHSVFGNSVSDTGTPPLLDLSEFPSLTNARGQNDLVLPLSSSMQTPGNKPYGNIAFYTCLMLIFSFHLFHIFNSWNG